MYRIAQNNTVPMQFLAESKSYEDVSRTCCAMDCYNKSRKILLFAKQLTVDVFVREAIACSRKPPLSYCDISRALSSACCALF